MSETRECTAGSGNVFADLGLPDAEELLLKAELAGALARVMEARKLSRPAAAELMGLDPSMVSALTHGRLGEFSVERLLQGLTALQQDVTISVGPAADGQGRILVNAA